ncbi:MAG: IS66 family insertion sequence element accessory protein TnpB [Bacteroidales bacterium]|nr:IS66 family insertion sequence element accessory protein TnpB [Bacteroidales bacterium]
MRKSFRGLGGLIRAQLRRNATSGEVFIFVNRRKDMVKLLRFENDGFIIYHKRLEKGTFQLPEFDPLKNTCTMNWTELVMMIQGVSPKKVYQRERYSVFDRFQQSARVGVSN